MKESYFVLRGDALPAETSQCGMERTTTRLRNTTGNERRGLRFADIPYDIRGQLLHLDVEQKQRATENIIQCDLVLRQCFGRNGPGVHHERCRVQNSKSTRNAGGGVAAVERGGHDVGHETPPEQSDVINEGRNVRLQKPDHS